MTVQRLLQGRIFYVVFGCLVVFLHVLALSGRPPRNGQTPQPSATDGSVRTASAGEPFEWWAQRDGLDVVSLQELAIREPMLAIALSILSVLLTVMGLVGLVVAGRSLVTGRIRSLWRFPAAPLPGWSFAELGRISVLTVMIASLLPFVQVALLAHAPAWGQDPHRWVVTSMLLLDAFVILTILTFAVGKAPSMWRGVGRSPGHLLRAIGVGVRGYLAVFPWIFLLLFLLVAIARRLGFEPPVEPIQELISQDHRPEILGWTMVLACLVGPVAEELFFRGVLYAAVRRRLSRVAAMLISAALFAFIHTNVIGFLPILLLGCLLAYLYERTGSLISPLSIHIVHNSLLMSVALVWRRLMPLG